MPNYGSYGLDPQGGGVGMAENMPVNVPGMGGPDMSFGGDMQAFMKKALMEQYERKKQEQARALQAEQAARRQADADRAMMMEDRNASNRFAQIDRMGQQGAMLGQRARMGGGREAEPDYGGLRSQAASMAGEQMQIDRAPVVKYQMGGPGILGGFTQADPHTMNAATRAKYLPQGSSMTGGGSSAPPSIDSIIGPPGSSRTPGFLTPEEEQLRNRRGSPTTFGR